eukprot:TRINITY_DN16687_c0_g2_i2.p1 TRINITY_DN16687_c0_g2~~TRINITY_DN16687_c0_g2_i2.p1  ORF type:complete len:383 (-),score=68.81 TRINITY_DN16687_c0_g2_i2:135-1202(-)
MAAHIFQRKTQKSLAVTGAALLSMAFVVSTTSFVWALPGRGIVEGATLMKDVSISTQPQPNAIENESSLRSEAPTAILAAFAGSLLLEAARRRLRPRRLSKVGCKAKAGWLSPRYGKAVQRDLPPGAEMYQDQKVMFTVTLKRPLGINIASGSNGVGVAAVGDSGSVHELLQQVLSGEKRSMWVQEGDQLEAVNGETVPFTPGVASEDYAVQMISSGGDEVELTFSRPKNGCIKVVFPDGKQVTAPRLATLDRLAEKVGFDSGCTCRDGRDPKCWYKDPSTGEVYILPLSPAGVVPSEYRKNGQAALDDPKGQYECWIPLFLEPAPGELENALQEEAKENARRRAEQEKNDYSIF